MEKRSAAWLLRYALLYTLIALGAYLIFFFDGKSLIWSTDGLMQVYGTLTYISDHVRAFFQTGRLSFDMVDLRLGQGMDTLMCMGFYGLTDPLNLLAALVTGNGMEAMYAALIGLRLFLAGAAFGLYARYTLKSGGWATSLAALAYAFSGYMIFTAVRHPHFVNGALYLPLVLYGIEKLLREKRPHAMIGFVALMLVTNFYFAYIDTAFAVLYVLMRLAFRARERRLGGSAADGLRLLGAYVLGFLASAVVFLPVAFNYTQNGRLGIGTGYTDSMLHYHLKYYVEYLLGLSSPGDAKNYWLLQGFAPVAWFCMTLLLFKRKKTRADAQILFSFGVLLVFGAIPMVGKLFNAGGYVTNRWSYALALPMCAACAVQLPELLSLGKKRLALLVLCWGAYAAAAAALSWRVEKLLEFGPGIAVVLASLCALAALRALRLTKPAVIAALMALTLFAHAFIQYSPLLNDYAAQFNDEGVYDRITSLPVAETAQLGDESFYRSTTPDLNDAHTIELGYHGVSYYWSMIPEWMAQYQLDVVLSTRSNFHNLHGLDARTSLCALAGLKYFAVIDGGYTLLPYGCKPVAQTEDAIIYENPYALPLGYAYETALPESALQDLSPLDRQQAFAQFAVVEDGSAAPGVPVGTYESAVQELPYTLTAVQGATLSAGVIATERGAKIALTFDAPANTEVYVWFDDIRMTDQFFDTVYVTTETANGISRNSLTTLGNSVAYEQKGLLVNLGCSESALSGCTMTFDKVCTLEYGSLRVLYVPIGTVTDAIAARAARPLENIVLSENRIAGTISLDAPSVLQLSVPYGAGWTATVDGEPAQTLLVGGMYLGVAIGAGDHAVALSYRTPYLLPGACVSAGALAAWGALALALRRRRVRA